MLKTLVVRPGPNKDALWSTEADDITTVTFIASLCRVPCIAPLQVVFACV